MDALKNIASKVKGGKGDQGGGSGGGDALDQGINKGVKQATGKDLSGKQTEQVSDYARTGFNKATGKDIPIADKDAGGK